MLQGLSGWHLVVILFIILLLFGAPKLPGLAKSLGQSMRILKKEVREDRRESEREKGSKDAEAAEPAADVDAGDSVAGAARDGASEVRGESDRKGS